MQPLMYLTICIAMMAAVRSTWSPCGLSMLSSITPLAERGRGHRFWATATWYVTGSIVGGLTLGFVMAILALLVHMASLSATVTVYIATTAAAVAAVSDVGVGGHRIPIHRRQLNERWMDQYRRWVYGFGFGWQIGSGLFTYIMTAGVYLMILMAASTSRPVIALLIGAIFGATRGVMIFFAKNITDHDALRAFHARFIRSGSPVALLAVGVMSMTAATLAWTVSMWAGVALSLVCLATLGIAFVSIKTGSFDVCAIRGVADSNERPAQPVISRDPQAAAK